MDKDYDELIKAANALKKVKVDGEYWLIMLASVNSILKVASDMLAIMQQDKNANKGEQDAISNNIKP